DSGLLTLQRGEVDQSLELNEKGLWVRKKRAKEDAPGLSESAKQLLKAPKSGEDPRLEAAKPRGRGTADASEKALEALQERRRLERKVADDRGRGGRMDIRTTAAAVGRAMVGGRSSSRGREAGAALWSKVGSGDSLEDLLSGKAVPGKSRLTGYAATTTGTGMDFDEEARKLWTRLNLDPSIISNGPYNAMDALWQHPETRAVFYVGNQTAASNLSLLQKNGVTHVVNCTDNMPNYHENTPGSPITYFRFDISGFHRLVKTDADAARFVQPMLDWVGAALASGRNVMVHCLAGAHRAGTTGCICLMHFAGLSAKEAVPAAKRCRPIIDPIGDFPELLAKLERKWRKAQLGMTNKAKKPAGNTGPVTTLNSSSQQCKPSKRHGGMKRWQGVQRTDEEAKEIVEKALGSCAVGQTSAPIRIEPGPSRTKRNRSPSPVVAPSSPSEDPEDDKFEAAWMDSGDEREAAKLNEKPSGGDVVVDFF
ncbi:DUSP9, partial [Symbiodinium sp. KB8]